MNNNYEYVQTLTSNKEELEKIKEQLKKEINYLFISDEEKEKLIEKVLQETIIAYTPNIIFPFLQYTKIKLKKEIEKRYFIPSENFTSEEKKILHLYLHQENNKFLSEEEIIKRLHTNSGTIYQALQKLELQKQKDEVKRLYPNYKKILKDRKLFFKEKTTLSEEDILLIGYYIGEIEDICLDIKEISEITNQGEKETEKKLITAFSLLTDSNNLNIILEKYPDSNRMLEIKAHSLGIKLNKNSSRQEKKEQSIKTEKSLLTPKQITLLKLLNEHHSSPLRQEELAIIMGYKNKQSISNLIKSLKIVSETNELAKQKIMNLYPHFFDTRTRAKKTSSKKQASLLNQKQKELLKLLSKNHKKPLSYAEMAKILGYKTEITISKKIKKLKELGNAKEEIKKYIETIYPEFFEEKPKTPKKKEKKQPKERPLISKKEEAILKALNEHHEHPISQQEIAKIVGYKHSSSLSRKIKDLKELCNSNEKVKAYVLTIYPHFLEKSEKKKEQTKKPLISKKQEELLKILTEHHEHPLTKEEIAKILGYKHNTSVYYNIKKLKELCNSSDKTKEYILAIYPKFLEKKRKTPREKEKKQPKERSLISKREKEILKTLNKHHEHALTQEELSKILGYKHSSGLSKKIKKLRELCDSDEKAKTYILTIYPQFLEEKEKPQQETPPKKKEEPPLLNESQKELLKVLKKHHKDSLALKELVDETDYSSDKTLYQIMWNIKRKAKNNPEVKRMVLEIYPKFFEKKKRKREKKRKLTIIQKQRKDLLQILKEQHDNHLTLEQLLPLTSYKQKKGLKRAIEDTRKRCEKDIEFKNAVLEFYPEFLEDENSSERKKEEVLDQTPETPKQDITERELTILQQIYQITPPNTTYSSQENIATRMNISLATVIRLKKKALDIIDQRKEVKEKILKKWPSFEEDRKIKENYRSQNSIKLKEKDIKEIQERITSQNIPRSKREYNHQEKILQGIINLEKSIFNSYVSKCTMNQKAMLALRLGYFNCPLDSKSISELFHVEEQEVIDLTKACLESAKSSLIPNNHQVKKRELRKKS